LLCGLARSRRLQCLLQDSVAAGRRCLPATCRREFRRHLQCYPYRLRLRIAKAEVERRWTRRVPGQTFESEHLRFLRVPSKAAERPRLEQELRTFRCEFRSR